MKEQTEIILKKMCEYVGADFNNIDFKSEQWYLKHEWDKNTEESFATWLGLYLYDNKEARMAFMIHPIKNKKRCNLAAKHFVLNYGWKLVD